MECALDECYSLDVRLIRLIWCFLACYLIFTRFIFISAQSLSTRLIFTLRYQVLTVIGWKLGGLFKFLDRAGRQRFKCFQSIQQLAPLIKRYFSCYISPKRFQSLCNQSQGKFSGKMCRSIRATMWHCSVPKSLSWWKFHRIHFYFCSKIIPHFQVPTKLNAFKNWISNRCVVWVPWRWFSFDELDN